MCLKNSYMFRNYDTLLHSGIVRMRKLQISKFKRINHTWSIFGNEDSPFRIATTRSHRSKGEEAWTEHAA